MEEFTNVTLAVEDDQHVAAPRLERQCKKRKMNDTYCDIDIEVIEGASANECDDLLLIEDNMKVPSVQKKAINSDLNFPKQFKRLLDCCERILYNIHEKDPGCTDKHIKGSGVDKRQLYVEFNAGMFEAIKKNVG